MEGINRTFILSRALALARETGRREDGAAESHHLPAGQGPVSGGGYYLLHNDGLAYGQRDRCLYFDGSCDDCCDFSSVPVLGQAARAPLLMKRRVQPASAKNNDAKGVTVWARNPLRVQGREMKVVKRGVPQRTSVVCGRDGPAPRHVTGRQRAPVLCIGDIPICNGHVSYVTGCNTGASFSLYGPAVLGGQAGPDGVVTGPQIFSSGSRSTDTDASTLGWSPPGLADAELTPASPGVPPAQAAESDPLEQAGVSSSRVGYLPVTEMASANESLLKAGLPGGAPFFAVGNQSLFFRFGEAMGANPHAVVLASSYFQRLLTAVPRLRQAFKRANLALPECWELMDHLQAEPGTEEAVAMDGAASEKLGSVLMVTMLTCLTLARKMVEGIHQVPLLPLMLQRIMGIAPSGMPDARELELLVMKQLGWRLGPFNEAVADVQL